VQKLPCGWRCSSPQAAATTAQWWADGLGAKLVHDDQGFSSVVEIPGAPFDSLDFAPVPEGRQERTARRRDG
jgi:hypothetical protein